LYPCFAFSEAEDKVLFKSNQKNPAATQPGFFCPLNVKPGARLDIYKNNIVYLVHHQPVVHLSGLMKRFAAIFLLSIHLFSLFGYMLACAWYTYQSNRFINEQISKDRYEVGDLVEVKIPVSMPSIEDWKDFAYITGQVQFSNNSYNYVKLRLTRDTMYLMCVPNYEKTRLIGKNIIDARNVADIPVSKRARVPFGRDNNIGLYHFRVIRFMFCIPGVLLSKAGNNNHPGIVDANIPNPGQPPEHSNTLS
jgi:hypothetical protein